jgi:hypothetical protein
MACIVVASPRRLAGAQRQHRLAAVERVDQGCFAHSQHDGMLGRRDIETYHVAHLGHEVRVGRELERLHPVRLQAEARQMRCTLETDKPPAFAMPRELQCVAFLGTLSKVVTITASTRHRRSCAARRNAARHAGRPLDAWQNVCAICRPSHSLSRLSLAATSLFCAPSAQANAIRTSARPPPQSSGGSPMTLVPIVPPRVILEALTADPPSQTRWLLPTYPGTTMRIY